MYKNCNKLTDLGCFAEKYIAVALYYYMMFNVFKLGLVSLVW